jgi:hypothetical protein
MVKIEDGSTIALSRLLNGEGQDDAGNPIRFEESTTQSPVVGGVGIPSYQATAPLAGDAEGRLKLYTFSLEDTLVKVSVAVRTKEEIDQLKSAAEARRQEEIKAAGEEAEDTEEDTTETPKTEKSFKTVSPTESSLPESYPPVEDDESLKILPNEEEEEEETKTVAGGSKSKGKKKGNKK